MKFLSTPWFVAAFAVSILSGGLARAGDDSRIRQFWSGELSVKGEGESALLPMARVGYFAIDAHVAWARLQTSAASTVATIWVRGQDADAPLDADRIEVWIVARDGAATPLQSRPSGKSEFACLGCVADPEKQGPIVEASFTFAPGSDPAADRLVVVAVDGRPVVMDPASALEELR